MYNRKKFNNIWSIWYEIPRLVIPYMKCKSHSSIHALSISIKVIWNDVNLLTIGYHSFHNFAISYLKLLRLHGVVYTFHCSVQEPSLVWFDRRTQYHLDTSTVYWCIASKLKAPRIFYWMCSMFLWVEIFIFFVCYHVVPKRHSQLDCELKGL